jgi:hypothetical protein
MNNNKIIYFSPIRIGIFGLIILIIGIIYLPFNLPIEDNTLSQDELNEKLYNYRLNSLGFKLISGGFFVIFITIVYTFFINNVKEEPSKINEIQNQKMAILIKKWTGKTVNEIDLIRKEFYAAKRKSS